MPALIGVVVLVSLAASYIRFYYAFDDMIVYVDEQDTALATAPKLAAHNSDRSCTSAFRFFIQFKRRVAAAAAHAVEENLAGRLVKFVLRTRDVPRNGRARCEAPETATNSEFA